MNKFRFLVAASLLVSVGCGDDPEASEDAGTTDAGNTDTGNTDAGTDLGTEDVVPDVDIV
ncbi:MAG: hypothetical protein ACJAYU_004274, partial [Bradymonadia bacterium]